jgi:hypothetical protein
MRVLLRLRLIPQDASEFDAFLVTGKLINDPVLFYKSLVGPITVRMILGKPTRCPAETKARELADVLLALTKQELAALKNRLAGAASISYIRAYRDALESGELVEVDETCP